MAKAIAEASGRQEGACRKGKRWEGRREGGGQREHALHSGKVKWSRGKGSLLHCGLEKLWEGDLGLQRWILSLCWGYQGCSTNRFGQVRSSHQALMLGCVSCSPVRAEERADWRAKDWPKCFLQTYSHFLKLSGVEKSSQPPHVAAFPHTALTEFVACPLQSRLSLIWNLPFPSLPWHSVCETLCSQAGRAGLRLRCLFSRDMGFWQNGEWNITAESKRGWQQTFMKGSASALPWCRVPRLGRKINRTRKTSFSFVCLFLQPWLALAILNFHAIQPHCRCDVGMMVTCFAGLGWMTALLRAVKFGESQMSLFHCKPAHYWFILFQRCK